MEMIADLHTHTCASTHAYNTVTEMARAAHELGLIALGVTDHGPAMEDAPHIWHFYNLVRLPRRVEGIWLLRGMEANVRGVDGTLDVTENDLKRMQLDWLIVSIHSVTVGAPALSEDEATRLWLNVAENPYVDCIGHSESCAYRYDYDAVTKVFAQKNKVVELNGNSACVRPGGADNMRALALACKRNGTRVAVNSDAHSIYHIARCDSIFPMLREIDFPPELVVTGSRENLIRTLREHHKDIASLMESENA